MLRAKVQKRWPTLSEPRLGYGELRWQTGKWQFKKKKEKSPPCVIVWGLGKEVRDCDGIGFKHHYSGNFMAT